MTASTNDMPGAVSIPRPQIPHQQLIISLFGLYNRATDPALPVAAIVSLLGDLGYDEPGVRSAVSRLKTKGILHATPVGRTAAYELKPSLRSTFTEGDERIFAPELPAQPHDWVLALFSVPEAQRNLRHKLRKALNGLGFGTFSPGVWIANGHFTAQAREQLTHQGLSDYVEFFRGQYVNDGDIPSQVARWWDLESIDELIAGFLELYGDAEEVWLRAVGDDPSTALQNADEELCRAAFTYYVPMLTLWRRLPYRDPNLPREYMPSDWKEPAARRAFTQAHRLIAPLADQYARRTIQTYLPTTDR